MNLYEINADIQRLLDCAIDPKTGEIINDNLFNEVERLNLEKEARFEYWGLVIKNQKADAEILIAKAQEFEKEAEDLRKKAEAIKNNNERIKHYLQDNLNGEKFKTKLISMYYHTSDKLIADEKTINFDLIPAKYLKRSLIKSDIKEAIKNGEQIEGCTVETNVSLVVR